MVRSTLCFLACGSLAVSLTLVTTTGRADPTAGECIAASESAIKLREAHSLRAARAQFVLCATASCPGLVRGECERQLGEVTGQQPTILFEIKDGAGNDLTAVKITMDGQPLLDGLDGNAIPIDPGRHTFRIETAGQAPVEKTSLVNEGEKNRTVKVSFAPAPVAPTAPPPTPAAVTPAPSVPAAATSAAEPTPAPSSWSGQKTVAIVLGVAGIAGLAVGGVEGASALSASASAKTDCPSPTNCPDHAKALTDHSTATSAGTISDVGLGVGAAAVAFGVVLWITAPRSSSAPAQGLHVLPSVGPRSAGLFLQTDF